MRKNKIMRFASLILVLTLLSTSVISGTFAKYVTSDSAEDSARVAKWGITIANTEGNVFVKTYTSDDTAGYTADTVISSADVVAPGTDNAGLTDLVVNGTPEVAVRVTYDATLKLEGWTVDGAEYCPLEITVESDTYKIDGTTITSVDELIEEVEKAIENCKKDYPANVAIDNSADAPTVAWSWPYSTTAANDVKDTALGDAAIPATIELTVAATATQID